MIKRPLTSFVIIFSLLFPTLTVAETATGKAPAEVQDLRYGVILYHFFQQSYFDALTEAMVGEQRLDMPYHQQSSKLLRGGMSLSYGMAPQAETIFSELLADLEQQPQQDRAWFYLARLYYLRGELPRAQQVLQNIKGELAPELQHEAIYMSANLLLKQDRRIEAEAKMAELPASSPWLAYYYFNRGSSLTLSGQWQQGVESFQQLVRLKTPGQEGATLRDRAYTASGFAHLGGSEYQQAIDDFLQVRLESPLVDRALLGYGWAAAQQEDYQLALSPWQALSQRSLMNSSVQESLLAIPYAYEKLGASASALQEYQRAVMVFQQELDKLTTAVTVFTDSPMAEIIADDEELGSDWISGHDYLPINDQAPYLSHLIAQDYFQSAVKDLSDLSRMKQYLQQSSERLQALQGVLDVQQQVWLEGLNESQRQNYRQRYDNLLAAKRHLQQQRENSEKQTDGLHFANQQELELQQMIRHAQGLIDQLQRTDTDISDEQQQLDFFQGLLRWQVSEQVSARSWEYSKHLAFIDESMVETEQRLQRLDQLDANRYDAAFSTRLGALQQRLSSQLDAVNTAIVRADEELRQLAINELKNQQQRISYYKGQAKLAIARLYDAGSEDVGQ